MVFLLHQLLSETAAKYPNKEALLFNRESITYFELEKASNRLANLLIESGVKRQDKIGIYMSRSINSIIGIFAILKAGATYVPIDPFCPESRINYIINKCEIVFLLSSREMLAKIAKAFPGETPLKKVLLMDGLDLRQEVNPSIQLLSCLEKDVAISGNNHEVNIVDADLSYILFTSGSTGSPKGVMLSHLNALTFINMACGFFNITKEDILSNISPLHFDLSVFDIYVALKVGAAVAIAPEGISVFPSKLAEFIQNNNITVWNSVPSALSLLANYTNLNTFDFSSLRLVLFAGEVFPVKYLRQLRKHIPSAKFYNIYGQTEANSSTYYLVDRVPDEDASLLPIGKSFPNFDVFALDENGKRITQSGSKGELFVRAHTVASGYWREPEQTKAKFIRNPLDQESNEIVYRTGDMVRLEERGNYVFLGRVDHMIKSRGYRIEMGEIESVLSNHPQVKAAVVIPIPDDLIGNRIAAVVMPLDGSLINKEDIFRHCAKQLPKYMVPETLVFKDSLPTTSSGKIDRKKLAELIIKRVCHS